MPLTIVSNCIRIAQELADVQGVTVTLLGGRLRPENASMVGILTERALQDLWFDDLFLGAGAIAEDGGIYSADPDEARANALMLLRASRCTVLADGTKFGRVLTWRVSPLVPGLGIITDHLPPDWAARLRAIGCVARVTPVQGSPRDIPADASATAAPIQTRTIP
jgi:DeoR family fructose operon transcriptional repressor